MTRALVVLVLATGGVSAGADDGVDESAVTADFDASGAVDIADFLMFREAYGSADLKYDIDGDGRVDLLDLFRLADQVEGVVEEPPPQTDSSVYADLLIAEPGLPRPVVLNRGTAEIAFADYSVTVSHGSPFGITSLRLRGQPVDFAHAQLPLADWEWFWYEDSQQTVRPSTKLLHADWGIPTVVETDEAVLLTYRRVDVLRPGIDLEVAFRFSARRSQFDVTYTIKNDSGSSLTAPYVMLGFPGFTNHRWISEVASAEALRGTAIPNISFLKEALAQNREEYLLLRHDILPEPGEMEPLRGAVVIQFAGQTYSLNSYFMSIGQEARLYSAHTNKQRYLTSHLYVTTRDISSGSTRSLTVHYIAAEGSE